MDGRRYVVCLIEEQRRKHTADRAAIVAVLREQLAKGGEKSLIGNKGYGKFVKSAAPDAFTVDEAKIQAPWSRILQLSGPATSAGTGDSA